MPIEMNGESPQRSAVAAQSGWIRVDPGLVKRERFRSVQRPGCSVRSVGDSAGQPQPFWAANPSLTLRPVLLSPCRRGSGHGTRHSPPAASRGSAGLSPLEEPLLGL